MVADFILGLLGGGFLVVVLILVALLFFTETEHENRTRRFSGKMKYYGWWILRQANEKLRREG